MDHCRFQNPERVPDWRWQRALGYLEGRQRGPTRKRDGAIGYKWIRQAVRFKTEFDRCQSDLDRYDLSERRPYLYWAWRLYEDETAPLRHGIEARLLTEETFGTIGFKCGTDPRVIEAYEAVFFNVRDRLQHSELIYKSVFRPMLERGLSEREYEWIWKLYAYALGPLMYEAISNKFVNPSKVVTPDSVNAAVQDDLISTLKMKAMLAAKTVSVNPQTQMEILHAFTKYAEVEQIGENAGRQEGQLLDHISAMMTALPFDVDGRDPMNDHQRVPAGHLTKFRASAIELTYEETLRGALGQPLPEAEQLVGMRFPRVLTLEQEAANEQAQ